MALQLFVWLTEAQQRLARTKELAYRFPGDHDAKVDEKLKDTHLNPSDLDSTVFDDVALSMGLTTELCRYQIQAQAVVLTRYEPTAREPGLKIH